MQNIIELSLNEKTNDLSLLIPKNIQKKALALLDLVCEGESQYKGDIGWLNPDEWGGENELIKIEEKAKEVRENADVFVLIGVGGSNQSARAVIKAIEPQNGLEILYSGNTLTPCSMNRLLKKLENKSVYINAIAKSFETLEPGVCFRILRAFLNEKYGDQSSKRITVTGTPGSRLHSIAIEHGYTFLTFPENIGGRFSTFSDVGLFPMAVAGIDIKSLVQGAKDMRKRLIEDKTASNLAVRYASTRYGLYKGGKTVEMLSIFEPRLRYFGKWWIQLFAESEGKDGKGLFPVLSEYSEDLHSVGQFVQDGSPILFETFITVNDPGQDVPVMPSPINDGFNYLNNKGMAFLNKAAEEATIQTHSERFPSIRLSIPEINEYYLGQLFYFFEFSCYLSGKLLEINPFNQPGVEAYKQVMFKCLEK